MVSRSAWAVLVLVWAALALPYIAVGTDDFEEYFTAATTTRLAVDAMRHGAWPLWNLDLGLGAPQPLRFHFTTHPLAPLCGIADCHMALRLLASLHVLIGAAAMMLLALRFTGHRLLALAAGITYCASSSVIQPLFTDDWPITAVNESALPALLYAAFALGDAVDRRTTALWTLVLGGMAGLLLSMSFPVVTLAAVAIVSLCVPQLRRRLPWLVLAAAITVVIGAGQIYHLFHEFALTPANVMRQDHPEPDFMLLLWSTFVRPLPLPHVDHDYWRTVFLGPPFAMAALLAFVPWRGGERDRHLLPLRVGLLIGIVGLLVPPRWLLSLNTAQWLYRTEINVFGTLLAVCAIHRWHATRAPRRIAVIVAVQIALVLGAVLPVVSPMQRRALGLAPRSEFAIVPGGLAEEIVALHRRQPGRVAFAFAAHSALRNGALNRYGLAPNQLPQLGVASLSSVQYGITSDAIYPTTHTLEGETATDPVAVRSAALLDALGVRYVVAMGDDEVAPDLREIRQWPRGLRLYVNDDAWPEAFFTGSLPGRLPRLPECGHDRLLCADFAQSGMTPSGQVEVTHLIDGLRLAFAPATEARQMVVTQWFRSGWQVTDGHADLVPAAEDLIGLRVPAGESSIVIRFLPRTRMVLFATGLASELVVLVGIVALIVGLRRRGAATASLR